MKDICITCLVVLFSVLLISCKNHQTITLTKNSIDNNTQISAIDTIETNLEKGVSLIRVKINYPLAEFDSYCYIVAKVKNSDDLSYKIEINHPDISVNYISETKIPPESQWGWFFINKGKFIESLPNIDKILDSLKKTNPKPYFVSEKNGHIPFYINGKVIKSLNYGDFVTKYKGLSFDSLDYKLYKLEADTLRVISSDGNDLLNQKDGIYFIPKPGFGVIGKFNKQEIFDAVYSASKQSTPPSELKFKSIK